MPIANSPLRYPGGKAILSNFLAEVLSVNGIQDGFYCEPYAGGAGAALNLLFSEHVSKILLNDADPCISSFWNAILHQKDAFLSLLEETPVSIQEWQRQRQIYRNQSEHSRLDVAFSGFYLNRCNRSGIMGNGGPIGGLDQAGKWKLDARFNKNELRRRIEKIHLYRHRIEIFNLDAIAFLRGVVGRRASLSRTLVYLDPPYYVKGEGLYLNHYKHDDHAELARFIRRKRSFRWLMTYDNAPEIHALYADQNRVNFNLDYSAHTRKIGSELLIFSNQLELPVDVSILGQVVNS